MSNIINVGIGEMVTSSSPNAVISAPNLGSCLGIAVFDPKRQAGGIVHCLLPLSKADPEKAKVKPANYVDTGFGALVDSILQAGSRKNDLRIFAVGGAKMNDQEDHFKIGKKNVIVLRKILWKNSLLLTGEDFGESHSRTISLHIGSGDVWLKQNGISQRMGK